MVNFNVDLTGKTILVTGAAGFIGANLVRRLYEMAEGISVVGLDSMNDYYDVSLKEYRLAQLQQSIPNAAIIGYVTEKEDAYIILE